MRGRIRVFVSGRHKARMPVSYGALAPLFADRIAVVDRPDQADLYLFAHVLDVAEAPLAVVEDWRARRVPVVLLSEEPFWDTIWNRRPIAPHRVVDGLHGALPVVQINHQTSDVFRFDQIPYYLLTHHRFASTYAARFARNARLSASGLRARLEAAPCDLCFLFERRPEPHHNASWPEAGLFGLCAWRTALAEACTTGRVERLGASWQGGTRRQALTNWYADKMARLDGRARIMGAIENTHQPDYLTEKLFDALANLSLPLYWAQPGHRLSEFGLPEGSWVNLVGMDPAEAAQHVADLILTPFSDERIEALREAQAILAARLGRPEPWLAERARLAHALPRALEAVLEAPRSADAEALEQRAAPGA
ncbi:hypothetical protein KY389_09085 [Paracoccus bogoriensis]|uniref:glycosyltransferase family 10 domain-containing protein n=1 Tax=Paracoccus bogoriensis TaxID=242065 RepID=UPI001CA59EFB|nr:glycosyltransferase family 10 [Paracoccus bogoriensis]MBW7056847.1 hypothetical protein [Paracoccus bogoriensis]